MAYKVKESKKKIVLNEECTWCLYKNKGSCKGRYDTFIPCLFARKIGQEAQDWERV